MSHRDSCPDEWEARRQGSSHAGYGDWTSRYSNPYSGYDGCPEAARAWERGYEDRKEAMAEEQRQEAAAQRAAQQRAYEEAQYEDMWMQEREMELEMEREMEQQQQEENNAAPQVKEPPHA